MNEPLTSARLSPVPRAGEAEDSSGAEGVAVGAEVEVEVEVEVGVGGTSPALLLYCICTIDSDRASRQHFAPRWKKDHTR